MTINLKMPDIRELKPRITVCGVGGAGGNAVNNMITAGLEGVEFLVANTDAQALSLSKAERIVQMGLKVTEGLGAGSHPEVGSAAAEEVIDELRDLLSGSHMAFITAGMGGGTGTGAAPVIARAAREMGILTVGVVTKPFHFEGARRMRTAESGIAELQAAVDTLIVIPNQNLFRVANERTTFADAFAMADQVLYSGVACITDLMVKEGLINLDFADVRAVMRNMGKAMMGTGQASGEKRALTAAEAAIANPLLDETSMRGARGLLISITGGNDLTLYEVDEAATRIREEVDPDANIILGATFDASLDGQIRVSVVATGIDKVEESGGVRPAAPQINTSAVARPAVAAPAAAPSVAPAPQAAVDNLAQLTEQMKANTQRLTELAAASQAQLATEKPALAAQFASEPLTLSTPAPAAVGQVSLTPMTPKPPLFIAPVEADGLAPVAAEMAPPAQSFIPPAPEPVLAAPRMPRPDEFPMPAQKVMAAQVPAATPAPQPNPQASGEKRRTSLLDKLASVGIGARRAAEEAAHAEPQMAPSVPPLSAPVRAPAPAAAPEARRPVAPPQAAPRAPQPALDATGRPSPVQRASIDDEHLDIPAFLRRQAH